MLESLARGLRAAGGILSPDVYQQNATEDRQMALLQEQRKSVMAGQVIKGIEAGAIDPARGAEALKQMGYDVPVGPTPETRAKQMDIQAAEELRRIAPNFRRQDGTFDREGLLSFVASRDPIKAAQYGKILGVSDPKRYTVGKSLVDERGNVLYSAPETEKPANLSPIGKLISERDSLPEGHPNRAVYDRIIANEQAASRDRGVSVTVNPNPLPLGKTAQGKVDDALIQTGDRLQRLASIESLFRPEFQTLGSRWQALATDAKEKLGFRVNDSERVQLQEFSKYKQEAVANLNAYIKETTGAAMSEQEVPRIRAGVPDPGLGLLDGDGPTQFKAKLDNTIRQLKLAEARYAYLKANGFALDTKEAKEKAFNGLPLDRMPALMKRRASEIEGEIRAAVPGIPNEQVERQAKERIAKEFGLVTQ